MPHAMVAGSDSSLRCTPFRMTQFLRGTECTHALDLPLKFTADPQLSLFLIAQIRWDS